MSLLRPLITALFALLAATVSAQEMPSDVWLLADSVQRTGDARTGVSSGHFAILDKSGARLWVFSPYGRAIANSPVLLGQAIGDDAAGDLGTRAFSKYSRSDKITPAGRFLTEAGENLSGEEIIWLDYESGLSMHRVRNIAGERRHQRVASGVIAQRRISYGCINVPADFFDEYLYPLFRSQSSVVYILPEVYSPEDIFPFMRQ
ncbi:MAG: L,D-transpeptidase [Ottowia sp.]|nr:L,D-transpeptidase [Ottowia sp.]